MISVQNVSVYFGGFTLFQNITFNINQKDRIGLVGNNGAGKSTLLKLMTGGLHPSEGNIGIPSETSVGYLPQQMVHPEGKTIRQEAESAFAGIKELENTIHHINTELAEREDYHSEGYLQLINRLNEANDRFQVLGGHNYQGELEQTLLGLGFTHADFDKPTATFSGGWRMRVELAKILLQKPGILLLDEPTNHLDIESIQWLENYLKTYPGGIMVISHDRAFLDAVSNRTIEISLGRIYDYPVSYSTFVVLQQERRELLKASYENQQKMIEDTERFIERFRYKATKAVQVQSRIKQLEKIDRIEVDEDDKRAIRIAFPPAPRSGNIVLEAKSLSKHYGEKRILNTIDFVIGRNEKLAFVGKNGEGKTTLSRIIVDELDYTGQLVKGYHVKTGYFAQNQDELLNEEKTVLQTIDDVAVGDVRTKIRDLLGAFLFSGETVDKKVKVLSGGERNRLAMVKLLLEPVNLLVLDEPTNHLDMRSKDILKQALMEYDGTLIIVSHDREFLDGLVTKVYEFRDKKIKEYLGGIYDFLERKKIQSLKELEKKQTVKNSSSPKTDSDNKMMHQQRKELEREIRKARNAVEETEEKMERMEQELEQMNVLLANAAPETTQDPDFYQRYEEIKKQLDILLQEWEKYMETLQKLENKKNTL